MYKFLPFTIHNFGFSTQFASGSFEEIFFYEPLFSFSMSFLSFTNNLSTPTFLSAFFLKSKPNFFPNLNWSK